MFFFIPLGFRYGDMPHNYSHLGCVYGPYDSRRQTGEAIALLYPNDKEEKFLVFEGEIVKVEASPLEKPESEKREPGNTENYEPRPDGGYMCKECGASILGATVAHPVHLSIMPGAGFGEVQNETVPYCPNCEKKPNFHGAPVQV